MTRLVGVRAVCDVCSAARAVLFCVVHHHVACAACDAADHLASDPDAASHQRVDLSGAVTALPFCEKCDNAPATSYCESEGVTLCDPCDAIVHANKSCTPHERRLITNALAQRTVSFTGAPPPVPNPSASQPVTSMPQVPAPLPAKPTTPPLPKPRRRVAGSPMKRRSRRDSSGSASEDRSSASRPRQVPSAPVRLSPAPSPMQFTDSIAPPPPPPPTQTAAAPITPAGTLAFMQAMSLMANREAMDYYPNMMPPPPYFAAPDLLPMSQPPSNHTASLMLDSAVSAGGGSAPRRPAPVYANIAPHPGNAALASAAAVTARHTPMDIHTNTNTVAAAAAAAATAAGEMFLLSATSSDQHNSASSDGFTPPFTGFTAPLDAAGLATAATAAAESTVAAIGSHTRHAAHDLSGDVFMVPAPRPCRAVKSPRLRRGARTLDDLHMPPPHPPPADLTSTRDNNNSAQMLGFIGLNDYFPLTDFDIPRDEHGMFGALDSSPFEPSSNYAAAVVAAATLPLPSHSHSGPQQSSSSVLGCSLDDVEHIS